VNRGRGGRRWRLVRASEDAVPSSLRRFHQRIRRRRRQALTPWLVLLAVVGLAGAAGWTVFRTSVFGVREVVVTGTDVVTPTQVRAAAKVVLGTPLATVDVGGIRGRVSALAPVRTATVRRQWPSTLVINVVERVAVAAVPAGERFRLIDDQGVVFRTVRSRPDGLPRVKLDKPGPDDPTTQAALRVLGALTPTLRERLTTLVGESPTRLRLELTGDKTVIWGDAEESDKKATVATALLDRTGTVIDVSAPEVVTVG
jgi:cell division protein FtsQ